MGANKDPESRPNSGATSAGFVMGTVDGLTRYPSAVVIRNPKRCVPHPAAMSYMC